MTNEVTSFASKFTVLPFRSLTYCYGRAVRRDRNGGPGAVVHHPESAFHPALQRASSGGPYSVRPTLLPRVYQPCFRTRPSRRTLRRDFHNPSGPARFPSISSRTRK